MQVIAGGRVYFIFELVVRIKPAELADKIAGYMLLGMFPGT